MTQRCAGSIDHMSLSEARKDSVSSQSRLTSFGDDEAGTTTYIGIVTSTNDEFESVVDEIDDRLSPPDELFYQWLAIKENMEDDGVLGPTAHNRAIEKTNYEPRFRQYLRDDADAQKAIQSLIARMERGEDIVLVCYCAGDRHCHRTMVIDEVEREL